MRTYQTAAAGLTVLFGCLNLVQADDDNNRLGDVLVLRGAWNYQNSVTGLICGDGQGGFENAAPECGLT